MGYESDLLRNEIIQYLLLINPNINPKELERLDFFAIKALYISYLGLEQKEFNERVNVCISDYRLNNKEDDCVYSKAELIIISNAYSPYSIFSDFIDYDVFPQQKFLKSIIKTIMIKKVEIEKAIGELEEEEKLTEVAMDKAAFSDKSELRRDLSSCKIVLQRKRAEFYFVNEELNRYNFLIENLIEERRRGN